jgi:serine/threonine-protein kinase 24/25/MST4
MMAYHKGEQIRDHYKIEEELGRGSFAIVHRGVSRTTGEEVAIKVICR